MLIAIEGIDGSGKHTQAEILKAKFQSLGMSAEILSFPRYGQTLFAKCIAAYLNGEYGDLASLPPESVALLYVGDRFESLNIINELSHSHDVLIFDRYVASNLAHQAARVDNESRLKFIFWLAQLEYEVFSLPKADYTVYLDMPAEIASNLIYKKTQRNYTTQAADLHEKDVKYLAQCREVYHLLASMDFASRWISIECVDSQNQVLNFSEIHFSIWSALERALNKLED